MPTASPPSRELLDDPPQPLALEGALLLRAGSGSAVALTMRGRLGDAAVAPVSLPAATVTPFGVVG